MNLAELMDWINLYKFQIFIGAAIFIYILYKAWKKKPKVVEEEKPPEIPQPPPEMVLEELDKKFLSVDMMEKNHVQFIKDMRSKVIEEISATREEYEKRKTQVAMLIEELKRLRIHVRTLEHQEKIFDEKLMGDKDGV